MANEITLNWTLRDRNPQTVTPGTQLQLAVDESRQLQINQAGQVLDEGSMSVPTTANGTLVPTPNLTAASGNAGVATFTNIDPTNYVQLGLRVAGTFYAFAKLKPAESWPIRLDPSLVLYALANTAAVKLQYKILQD